MHYPPIYDPLRVTDTVSDPAVVITDDKLAVLAIETPVVKPVATGKVSVFSYASPVAASNYYACMTIFPLSINAVIAVQFVPVKAESRNVAVYGAAAPTTVT